MINLTSDSMISIIYSGTDMYNRFQDYFSGLTYSVSLYKTPTIFPPILTKFSRTNDNYSVEPNKKMFFCTTDHIIDKLLPIVANISQKKYIRPNVWFCSTIMLHDFYLRKKETDICFSLWMYAYQEWKQMKNYNLPKPPKMILILPKNGFQQLTANILTDFIPEIKLNNNQFLEKQNIHFPKFNSVTTMYDEGCLLNEYNENSDIRYIRAALLAYQYNKNHHKDKGVYLIFAPGKFEIDIISNELTRLFKKNVSILPIYDDWNINKLLIYYQNSFLKSTSYRKIIISTNILECYVDVDIKNITLIIDTLTDKCITPNSECITIDHIWITKTNSLIRKNMVNSTNGVYIAMIPKQNYQNLLDINKSELEQCCIDKEILRFISFGIDPKIILKRSVSENKIDNILQLLTKLNCIVEDVVSQNLILTDLGKFCLSMPLSVRNSITLYYLKNVHNKYLFIYLAVICTVPHYGNGLLSFFRNDYNCSNNRQEIIKQFNRFIGYSSIDTIINIWIDIYANVNIFELSKLKIFCYENNLNFRKMRDIITLIKNCIYHLKKLNTIVHIPNTNTLIPKSEIDTINRKEISEKIYDSLQYAYHDYRTTMYYDTYGNLKAICDNYIYTVDIHCIDCMRIGHDMTQVYYSILFNQRTTKTNNVFRMIGLFHSIPKDSCIEDVPSIFSSDMDGDTLESDSDIEFSFDSDSETTLIESASSSYNKLSTDTTMDDSLHDVFNESFNDTYNEALNYVLNDELNGVLEYSNKYDATNEDIKNVNSTHKVDLLNGRECDADN